MAKAVKKVRIESDFIGDMEVDANAYYGVQSLRSLQNFATTGRTLNVKFIKNLARVKKASAITKALKMPEQLCSSLKRFLKRWTCHSKLIRTAQTVALVVPKAEKQPGITLLPKANINALKKTI